MSEAERPKANGPAEPSRPSPGPFETYIARWRGAIDGALLGGVLVEPDHELRRYLYRPALDFLARGGKRIRPILVVMACEACGGSTRHALPVAASVEHFQSAALIHDDIADEAETRRGLPALHRSEGAGLAIDVGDLALVESFRDILDARSLNDATRLRLLDELAEMMVRTVEGQALDVGWARDGRWDVTADDYLRMAELKTANYSVATPLVMGAVVAGAPEATVEALRDAGIAAGLAFQIADDLLDLEGTAEVLGKQPLGDLTEGKRTLAVVSALSTLGGGEREELESLLSSHVVDPVSLQRARDLIVAGGGIERSRSVAADLAGEAATILADLGLPEGPATDALLAMPYYVLGRQS